MWTAQACLRSGYERRLVYNACGTLFGQPGSPPEADPEEER